MLNDLLFLVFGFELVLLLNSGLTLSQIQPDQRESAARLLLKTSLPLTLILLTGTTLLIAAADSTSLTEIHAYLSTITPRQGSGLEHSIPALGILMIVMGTIFRMRGIPVQLGQRALMKESRCWISTGTILLPLATGLCFLSLFASQIGVIQSAELEQIFYFSALIILMVSTGLLLVEKQLRGIFDLLMIQTTGVFLALLSGVCWRWRHVTENPEAGSILQTIQEYAPELLFSWLSIVGLAFLVDALAQQRTDIQNPVQLQGLFKDQRLAGMGAVILLATLIGFPGLPVFRLKWQTLLLLLEIHQTSMTGTMATLHTGYLGLAMVVTISAALTAFICARLLFLICFARPLARHRRLAHRGMIFACYCCVIGSLIFSLKMIVNF